MGIVLSCCISRIKDSNFFLRHRRPERREEFLKTTFLMVTDAISKRKDIIFS